MSVSEPPRSGGERPSPSPAGFVGAIPPGLNRIRTRRTSSRPEESAEARSYGASRPPVKSKKNDQKTVAAAPGRGRTVSSSSSTSSSSKGAGQHPKGKTISRWLASYFSPDDKNNNTNKFANNAPANIEERKLVADAEIKSSFEGNDRMDRQQSSLDTSTTRGRVPKCIKSFSHELGPKGGIAPSPQRAHSYSDLTELLGSLCSRYDAAKEVATQELASFAGDVIDVIEQIDPSMQEDRRMAEDLLILVRMCVEMAETQFRAKCEMIVQDLTEKRRKCHTGVLKWLFTRMLFILTRCTRLLQFQKDGEPIDEKSLHNFKKCLESVPSVEMSWGTRRRITDPHPEPSNCPEAITKNDGLASENKLPSKKFENKPHLHMQDLHQADNMLISSLTCGSIHEQGQSPDGTLHDEDQDLDGSNAVICRICEEIVPICHLESHSYICAYADKCDQNCLDLDDRLSNLEEMLDQIVESRSMNVLQSYVSPEIMRMQSESNATNEGYSPKVSEWRNKGVEGMFEDIHEMDTAFIDDSPLLPVNLKGHLGIKLSNNYGTSSSTGSITSVSSTNTPKTGHFDSFWLTLNNPSEQEDVQQMIDLADIARCGANADLSTEGSHEFLLACMQDLQDILQNSRLKALVIDTFGARIEKLLREKYMSACNLMDVRIPTSDGNLKDNSRLLLDIASQNSAASTPVHSSQRERTSIDDFEIIKPISRGAFGKVFLARKYTTGDLFAIKVLKKLDMLRKNHAQRILAERNILITVRNPFVVRFYYSFTCRDNLYLVMEYLNGGDLYSLLRKVGCLEEEVARVYIAELVLALEYLHSLGIVHRDLKPDNILIAHDGHIKLTDFGLSKIGLMNCAIDLSGQEMNANMPSDAISYDPQEVKGCSRDSAVGTPDYLAPEILLGTEHGYAADWWSVGIILFELITGVPPFNAEHPEVVFDNILNNKIPWPPVPDYMSHEAQDFINRLLIHDPNERLGANGSMEVKSHPFFRGIDWDNLALQKAAFVPNLDGADDTSYFVSRFSQTHGRKTNDRDSSHSDTDTYHSSSESEAEVDECGDLADFGSSPLDLSMLNFSFKNLSQLASINHDVLLQNAKDPTNCSPSRAPDT